MQRKSAKFHIAEITGRKFIRFAFLFTPENFMKNKIPFFAVLTACFFSGVDFPMQIYASAAEGAVASGEKTELPRTVATKVSGDELVRLAWTDLSGFRGALLHGADPNARTSVGDYPLIRLAFGGNVEAVKILLDFNAKMNVLNLPEQTSASGTLRALTSFVTEREKMDLKNYSVATAIIAASPQVTEIQKIRMMQLILDYGYPADFRDGWGKTALMTCVLSNQKSLAKLLIGYGADSEANDILNGKTPRDYANSEEMFRILRGRKIYAPSSSPTYGKIKVRLFKPRKFPVILRDMAAKKILRATQESPLHLAATDGDVENVRELLASGAQAITYDLDQKTPLHRVCEKQEIPLSAFRDICRLLESESGAKIFTLRDRQGRVPFHTLCCLGREDLVEYLASRNPKQILVADSAQNTPLHLAVNTGEKGIETVRFLLEQGAPVSRKNDSGETPLHRAVVNADAEMFYLLFSYLEIDPVSGINSLVGDPLFSAAFKSFSSHATRKVANENLVEILRLLIESGIKPGILDPDTGRNALHWAVDAGCVSAVSFLLSTNIDVNKKDYLGETPLDVASKSGKSPEVKALLLARGARAGKGATEERRADREAKSKMTAKERRASRIERAQNK